MAMARFSKAVLRDWLTKSIAHMEHEYGFTRATGWSQVNNKGEAMNRAYGEYDMLLTILDNLNGWGFRYE